MAAITASEREWSGVRLGKYGAGGAGARDWALSSTSRAETEPVGQPALNNVSAESLQLPWNAT